MWSRSSRLAAGAAVALGGGLAALVPALPAVGQSSPPSTPIILERTATLIDRGVAVTTRTLVACRAHYYAEVDVTLAERSGRAVVNGADSDGFLCTGRIQTVSIVVHPEGILPFTPGPTFERATLGSNRFYTKDGTIRLVTSQ